MKNRLQIKGKKQGTYCTKYREGNSLEKGENYQKWPKIASEREREISHQCEKNHSQVDL